MPDNDRTIITYLREDIKEVKRDLSDEIGELKSLVAASTHKTDAALEHLSKAINEHDKRISVLERAEQARSEHEVASEGRVFSTKQGIFIAIIALAPFFWEIISKFFL